MHYQTDILHSSCLKKARYRSENKAKTVAKRLSIPLRVYACPHCFGWHLTKRLDPPQ